MSFLQHFKEITTFAFDIDGVLTDGTIFVFDDGEQVRRMNIKDGYALQLAIKKGYRVVVISGAVSEAVKIRLNKLGVQHVFLQVHDKKSTLESYIRDEKISWKELLFMGDDIPDLEAMQHAGMSCAPLDAASAIRDMAKYISPCKGGEGCVRDVIEKVMKLRGDWQLDTHVPSK
ncbi:MAG TPA: HAD-IIIA family hydrolase [Puia sp.]|nr:HAD-IIIA family hydrolase [Puia sp.]